MGHNGLNPSLGGIWSWRMITTEQLAAGRQVLILLWVEYGLGVNGHTTSKQVVTLVLILLWVEYGLGGLA